jgi:hypothetical protein
MNKTDYLKKYNLINEYYKKNGYIITEADNAQNDMNGQEQMMDEPMGDDIPQGNSPMGEQPMPDMGMGDMMGGDLTQGEQPMPDMGMDNSMPQGAEGFDPQGQVGQDPAMSQNPIDSGENEEVIDVDDLTNSQEETEHKVDSLTNKFDKLFQMIGSFEEKLKQSDENINALKQEIEKRNPTQIEKMSLRSKDGYPFNVSPDEYWNEKEQNSNYSSDDDENGINQQQYQITKNDVDNMTDWASISKSLENTGAFKNLKDLIEF